MAKHITRAFRRQARHILVTFAQAGLGSGRSLPAGAVMADVDHMDQGSVGRHQACAETDASAADTYRTMDGRVRTDLYPCAVAESFYRADGDTFVPSDWTRGPWDPEAQHAGPPAALMGRAAEFADPDPGWLTSRISIDIVRPVPLKPLHVTAAIKKAGRTTQLTEVVLRADDVELASGRFWRIRRGQSQPVSPPLPHPLPDDVSESEMVHPGWDPSYFTSLEWRYVRGSLFEPGPASVWMRSRHPLVEGEPTSPLSRLLIAADSGNGVSSVTPLATSLFINVELSVHLVREMRGEWICLDAVTTVGDDGVGVARSTLWDDEGCVGYGAQSLLMASR